ncbi:hypothetical protein BVX97_00100 [bacterium E08(2017)]|nr:hypothetical protein BVX97_00100 [bacterium E08(2017)]
MNRRDLLKLIAISEAAYLLNPVLALHAKPKGPNMVSGQQPSGTLDASTRREVDAAIDRALDWLSDEQARDGSWSKADFPALTALALQAFALGKHPEKKKTIKKAKDFILTCVQDDGGIYKNIKGRKGGGLSNYNTAICTTALFLLQDDELLPVIRNARGFIAAGQHQGDDIYKGGFGYDRDTKRAYTDLLNTFYSVETMKLTESVEDSRPSDEKKADIDWKSTIEYIEKIQNNPDSGPENEGGFFYKPGESKAGETKNKDGEIVFRSYGSMTYVGMLSLIYSDVDKNDPRVMSAFHWSARHWSLDENPGMGGEGLYFFYNVLAKCLSAFGRDNIPQSDGSSVDWRKELAVKLLNEQKVDNKGRGYWVNDTGRFWENDPVLATSYALIALQLL